MKCTYQEEAKSYLKRLFYQKVSFANIESLEMFTYQGNVRDKDLPEEH